MAWLVFVVLTVLCWGVYGVLLHSGTSEDAALDDGRKAAFVQTLDDPAQPPERRVGVAPDRAGNEAPRTAFRLTVGWLSVRACVINSSDGRGFSDTSKNDPF